MNQRYCNIERPFHGTCLNLTLGMGCSQFPNSLCLKYADINNLQSKTTKKKIELAKTMGLYDNNKACVGFDVPCSICEEELLDASSTKKVKGIYVCDNCK